MSVRLVNITKEFADPEREGGKLVAVRDFDLEIQEGEFVTLLGPSGCGKTTTLRMIAGFEMPTTGEVWIGGKNVSNDPPNKRDTSMVFQSYAIFPHMSVEQNVGFGLELKGRPKAEITREVRQIMEVMGIADLAHRRPDQLSGGQQQRVALARAIVNRPSVLLFDEPLSNLDAKLREQMRVEIRRIQQTFKITSVYVTHDQSEAMTVSDRIVVMNKGQMMQVGSPFEIYSRPANQFVADFIGRVNLLSVTVEHLEQERNIARGADGSRYAGRQLRSLQSLQFEYGLCFVFLLSAKRSRWQPVRSGIRRAGGCRRAQSIADGAARVTLGREQHRGGPRGRRPDDLCAGHHRQGCLPWCDCRIRD